MNRVEFWIDENGNALFPAIVFRGNAVARYMPADAVQKVTWEEWRNAVLARRHRLMQHVVDEIADSPEQTLANIFNAEEQMDFEKLNKKTYTANDFVYDG